MRRRIRWINCGIMSESTGKNRYQVSPLEQARFFFRLAHEHQKRGEFEQAIELYKLSIDTFPTAEAHAFLGWTYSNQHRYCEAIECCMTAILVNPELGNPYNDIGAYLIELGRPCDAIPYLKQAINSPHYEARHYPHHNLARIYEAQCRYRQAMHHYEAALEICPDHRISQKALARVRARMN